MMAARKPVDFAARLAIPMSKIEEPILLPQGIYKALVTQYKQNQKEKRLGLTVFFRIVKPYDVDEAEWEEFKPQAHKLEKAEFIKYFSILDENGEYEQGANGVFDLKQFITNDLDVFEAQDVDAELGAMIPHMVKKVCLIKIEHRLNKSTERPEPRITLTLPLEKEEEVV